jgi:rubrerythrin
MAEKNCKLCFRYNVCYAVGRMLERAETCSKYAPDVEKVKHGEWEDLYKGKYDNPLYTCSECYCRALYKPETDELGNTVFKQELSKVCPHCGAKMDGERRDA